MKLESFFCNWKISSSFPTSKIFANFTETFQLQQSLFNFGSNFPISNFLTSHFFNRPFQLHVSQSNPLIVMDTKFQIFGVRFSNGFRFVDSFFVDLRERCSILGTARQKIRIRFSLFSIILGTLLEH